MRILTIFLKDEKGATAIEYGLIVAMISIVGIIATGAAGQQVTTSFSHIASTLASSNR
ncbi:MAG: Flp family type IVb pilin [Rickettsiales bacterium]|jgi:pilus assembly protein Flp/PilA